MSENNWSENDDLVDKEALKWESLEKALGVPDSKVSDDIQQIEDRESLKSLAVDAKLTDREISVLNLRFGQDMTLLEAGRELNVGEERVRQIQFSAISKLQNAVRTNKMLGRETD